VIRAGYFGDTLEHQPLTPNEGFARGRAQLRDADFVLNQVSCAQGLSADLLKSIVITLNASR
jgi:hypothetical protein